MRTTGPCPARIDARPVDDPLTHYIVVRADLPPGVQAAQIAHAAGESSPGNLPSGTHAIVLACPNEGALFHVAQRLGSAGMPFTAIEEPDAPWDGALMAIGLPPAPRSTLRRYLSSLPLFSGSTFHGGVAQSRAPGDNPEVGGSRPSSPSNSCVGGGPGAAPGVMNQESAGSSPAPRARGA